MAVRDRIAELIAAMGVTQAHIARTLGESEDWVSRRVRGVTPITADELPRWADVLRVHPCNLLDIDGYPEALARVPPLRPAEARTPGSGGRRPGTRVSEEPPDWVLDAVERTVRDALTAFRNELQSRID